MTPPRDDTFHALAHPDRRRLLTALAEHNSQADDALYVPEDVPIEDTQSERRRIQLYYTHLPKLEETGLIHWDRDTDRVTNGPQFDEIRPILGVLTDDSNELTAHE